MALPLIFVMKVLAVIDVISIIIAFISIFVASTKFSPGMFKTLFTVLATIIIVSTFNEVIKVFVMFSPELSNVDKIVLANPILAFITFITPIFISLLFLIVAFLVTKMSRVYGFAEKPVFRRRK